MKIFINGKISPKSKAKLSIFDRGFLYGDGLFETLRSYSGKVFMLNRHLDRLYNSAKIINLKIPINKAKMKMAIYRLLRVNKLKDAYIRLAVSRGEGRVGLDATTTQSSNIVIIAKKFYPYPGILYKKGLNVAICNVKRNEGSVLSRIKSLNYLNNIVARIDAQKKGFNDAILLNNRGNVCCGAVSNVFLINKNTIFTPSLREGVLAGIVRELIIKIAPKNGFRVKETVITPTQLMGADEVFFTNTLMEILPVSKVNNRRIRDGKVGKKTKLLQELLKKKIINKLDIMRQA